MTHYGKEVDLDSIFSLKNVAKVYGDDLVTQVRAVDDVSLEIKKGEFIALVGPSGSGKSTLLNLMSGLDHPTSGSISLVGKDLCGMGEGELADYRRDHIGFVFQSYNLIPVLSVAENIEYVMLLQKVPKKVRSERVKELLAELDLSGYGCKRPAKLSGGQQQRVAVARAIAAAPDIILADEPTANLDSKNGEKLLDFMTALNAKYGITFVFATHDRLIMERAQRLVRLKDGHIDG